VDDHHHQQLLQQKAQVDTSTTKNIIKLVSESRAVGTATLTEMTLQAGNKKREEVLLLTWGGFSSWVGFTEQLGRVENGVDRINDQLDQADRILRGMESVGGSIKNAFSSTEKHKLSSQPIDRTVIQKTLSLSR
jgi:hypothetical protein